MSKQLARRIEVNEVMSTESDFQGSCPEVLMRWTDDGATRRITARIVDDNRLTGNHKIHFCVEELARDAMNNERWEYVRELAQDTPGEFVWVYSLLMELRRQNS